MPAGMLVGQVTVTATTSGGQLVVRLATPATEYTTTAQTFQMTGHVDHNGRDQALTLRGCGHGCFLAPVAWAAGNNQVRLAIAAPGWHGGDALLDIPWPAHADPALLPAVLAAMNAVQRMTVHEAVTSDYSGYPRRRSPRPHPPRAAAGRRRRRHHPWHLPVTVFAYRGYTATAWTSTAAPDLSRKPTRHQAHEMHGDGDAGPPTSTASP